MTAQKHNRLPSWIEPLLLLTLGGIVFASRLPFLQSGYGRDPDAWRVINAAMMIASTGEYHVSRFPGYPVPEFAYAIVGRFSTRLLPTVAVMSALSAILFALIVKRYGSRDFLLAGLTLAFVPVVYINSTNAMDYVWALTFVLAALLALSHERYILAGALCGIAAGCRITSAAMLVPLSLLFVEPGAPIRAAFPRLLRLWLTAFTVTAAAYLPVYLRYGKMMFTFIEEPADVHQILYLAGESVWGRIGLFGLALAVVGLGIAVVAKHTASSSIPRSVDRRHVTMWLVTISLYVILFLRLPAEAGYLVIVVPFVLLLLARFLPRPVYIAVSLLIIASSFVDIRRSGIYPGSILQNRYARLTYLSDSRIIAAALERLESGSILLVAGWMCPQIETIRRLAYPTSTKTVVLAKELESNVLPTGYDVYIVPIDNLFPDRRRVEAWQKAGAKLLPVN